MLWNLKLPLVPVVRKMSRQMANLVIKFGFGMVPPTQASFYGQGVYFTNSISYSDLYPGDAENTCFLISLVAPGNAFPVTDFLIGGPKGFEGKACTPGYQSHVVMVKTDSHMGILEDRPELFERAALELVIPDPACALPLFLLDLKKSQGTLKRISNMIKIRREWSPETPGTIGFVSLCFKFC